MDVLKLVDIPGLMSRPERLFLAAAAVEAGTNAGGGTILEAGSGYGSSAAVMRLAAPSAVIHTIDMNDVLSPAILDRTQVLFHEGSARDFRLAHPELAADFLFIDADHSFAGVLTDYAELFSLLRPGGLLGFHDVCFEHYGVKLFGDALTRGGHLTGAVQVDTLRLGRLAKPGLPDLGIFLETLREHAGLFDRSEHMRHEQARSAGHLGLGLPSADEVREGYVIGKGEMGKAFAGYFGLPRERLLHSWEVRDVSATYFLCSHETTKIMQYLTSMGLPESRVRVVSDHCLSWLYRQDLLESRGERLASLFADPLTQDIVRQGLGGLSDWEKESIHRSGFLHLFITRLGYPG